MIAITSSLSNLLATRNSSKVFRNTENEKGERLSSNTILQRQTIQIGPIHCTSCLRAFIGIDNDIKVFPICSINQLSKLYQIISQNLLFFQGNYKWVGCCFVLLVFLVFLNT